MKSNKILYYLPLLLLLCFINIAAFADTTYVKFGSTWKYLDAGTAAPTGGGAADWRNIGFNDAAWNSGPAEFGYGENKERTTISYGGNPASKYITTYFRKVLNVADISLYSSIRLNAYIDDGAVIYVNGTEVGRTNMAAGAPVYGTLALAAAAENGNVITKFDISTAAFVSGNNLIAVEVHQSAATSSDLSFDLELIAKPGGGTIFNFASSWKYIDNGSNQGTAWIPASFNDASWKTGVGKFGYGDPATTIVYSGCPPSNYPAAEVAAPSCATKFITTYFRKTFTVTGVSNYSSFTINAYRDDGIAVYVNGAEVVRDLLAAGATYTTLASNAGDDGQTINTYAVPASFFVEGSNTIAVELHQSAASSTDISFDMQLIGNSAATTEPDVFRGPFMQMVSGNAVTIRWSTTAANTSRVLYGNTDSTLTTAISDNTSVTDHEMRITGLTPDTKYYYAVGSANSLLKGSYRNYFTTSPPASATRKIRIGVFGDGGTGNTIQKGSRDNYLKLKGGYNNSEMAIMLGDNAYNQGLESEHNTAFFNIYNNNVFDNNVIFTVPGNHEYANNGTRAVDHNIPYYSIFTVPTAGESGGLASGTEHYYSYNYGNIHFIMLDTYGIDGGNHLYDDTTNGVQALWLKADLADNAGTHKWTIVCMHHPPYTNGTHISDNESDLGAVRQKIVPILERFGVDVVLSGHSHVYERSFLVKDHTGLSGTFNNGTAAGGKLLNKSSARYDGSAGSAASINTPFDSSAAVSSCPYFTIDSVYKHGTVYVVAGSAGQVFANTNPTYPVFYTRNESASDGGEGGALYLEIQDNRLDAKFVGSIDGTIRDQFTIMKGVNKNTIVNTIVNTPATLTASWIGGYNWYTAPFPPIVNQGSSRSFAVTPTATGDFVYYVNDSISPKTTCIADTFTLRVTSTLAVSVTNFDAILKNKKVLVQWTTSQEINSDYFTVERSANGQDFDMVMVISGKGNSSTATNYEFIDSDPLQGVSYYRLTATDKNGDKKIVGVRTVNNKQIKSFTLTVKPNPVINNEVNADIVSVKRQLLKIKVFAINGGEVYSKSMDAIAGTNQLKFNLPAGTYILSIEGQDNITLTEKLIVQ